MITVQAEGLNTLQGKLNYLPSAFRQKLYIAMLDQADQLVSVIKLLLTNNLLNVQSGKLRNSIAQQTLQNDASGVVMQVASTGNLPYAAPQNNGCAPYIIEAVNAKALAFEMGGVMVFAKRVNHPGLKGVHYMETGLKNKKTDIINAMQGAMKGAWGS